MIKHGSTPCISQRTDENIILITAVKFLNIRKFPLNIKCMYHIDYRTEHRRFIVITTGVEYVGTLNLLIPDAPDP